MLVAIASLSALGIGLGLLLGIATLFLRVEADPLHEELAALLPGSQCGQCGYPGCALAAAALAEGKAAPTLCPPGGRALAETLASRLGVTVDLEGVEEQEPMLAFINEALCVGCTRCFKRCPTDAILGSSRQIHTVIAAACTGCGKCVEICPTECVQLIPQRPTLQSWVWPKPALAA